MSAKKTKCSKVKNPCKMCLGPVSKKNGLQCEGACMSWVHYECLNYTPGRIKDVQAGIIKVACPCPDCDTKLPKEYRTDQPFSCTNMKCPANNPAQCDAPTCPTNADKAATAEPIGCAIQQCGKGCKSNSPPQMSNMSMPHSKIPPCAPPHHPLPECAVSGSSDKYLNYNKCESGCSSDVPGDRGSVRALPSLQAIEQMCNTVGQLSNQINDMMARMKQVVHDKNQSHGKAAARAKCPKPCFCPGNPLRKR